MASLRLLQRSTATSRQRLATSSIAKIHTSIIARAVVTDRDIPLNEELHNNRANSAAEMTDKDPQLGDYPQLPYENLQNRRYDPAWWDPQEKRNFGETVSVFIPFLS